MAQKDRDKSNDASASNMQPHLKCAPSLCHPERNEGSQSPASEILRFSQDDKIGTIVLKNISSNLLCIIAHIAYVRSEIQTYLGKPKMANIVRILC